MKLPRLMRKAGGRQDWREMAGKTPPEGADPQANHPPDLAGRRAFLAKHILIHTHVPKTAGSTLAHALAAMVGGTQAMDLRLRRALRPRDMTDEDKRELRMISGHFVYGMHERFPQRPLYLAAVRDPVERAVSYYRFVKGAKDHPNHAEFQDLSFEESWGRMTGRAALTRSNEQSAILSGLQPGDTPDEDLLWQRAKEDYFLIIPQGQVDEAIRRLRAAYGLPWTKVPQMNRSHGDAPEPGADIRIRIEAENALDLTLVDWAGRNFEERLDRAVAYIAHHCLKDGG